jgi:hypothetical protein
MRPRLFARARARASARTIVGTADEGEREKKSAAE